MMGSPGLSSSSPASNGANKPAVVFEDLWTQLRECHQSALQELESKVSKLKKERCLDAQKLQEFYNRHHQLKEEYKSLQDTVSLLEERLRTGPCDRCAVSEEHMRKNQVEYEEDLQQNLCLIAELEKEKSSLQGENGKLSAELDKLKRSCPEPRQTSSPEQEEGVIPDSPLLQSSLPVVNKLKRRKKDSRAKHVRYAETPLPQPHSLLLSDVSKEPLVSTENQGKADILVPNTCEMDTSQTPPEDVKLNHRGVVAETCRLDLPDGPPQNTLTATDPQRKVALRPYSSSLSSSSHSSFSSSPVHCPDPTTERSPSLLPIGKLVGSGSSLHQSKRMKEEGAENAEEYTFSQQGWRASQHFQGQVEEKRKGQQMLFKHPSAPLKSKESLSHEQAKAESGKKRSPLQDQNSTITVPCPHAGKGKVEPMWSMDPAAALSQYDPDTPTAMEEGHHSMVEHVDTDTTFISHSLLQDGGRSVSGHMQKASDSLDEMFDNTAYGEYKSGYITHLDQTQPCDEEEEGEGPPPENTGAGSEEHKARNPTFAHVTVVRKKDERRKLKGTTCKECEVYYAHLPEEERLKKLSACSRHRFLFLPPCTPEHFWEVGFPSTQTCVERGYIKEDKNPQPRLRRRLPYNALFSPKHGQQET